MANATNIEAFTDRRIKRRERFQAIPSMKLSVEDLEESVELVDRIVREGVTALGPYYERIVTNIAWGAGKQLVRWNQADQDFVEDPRLQPRRENIVPLYTNLLRQYLFLQIARMGLSNIIWTTMPRTTQLADVRSDEAASKLLRHVWGREELRDPQAFFENWLLFFETGVQYANPEWEEDPDGEQTIPESDILRQVGAYQKKMATERPEETAIQGDPEAAFRGWVRDELDVPIEQVTRKPDGSIVVNKGQLVINWYDALSLIEDFSVKRWKDKRFFVLIDRVSLEEMCEQYPEHEEDFIRAVSEPSKVRRPGGTIRATLGNRIESPYVTLERYRLFLAPSTRHPKGYRLDVCADVRLEGDEGRYDHGKVPIIPFYETPDTHDARPTCTYDDLWIIQRGINKRLVQIADFIDETVHPQPMAEDQSVPPGTFQGGPHIIVYKRGSSPPGYMEKPVVPAHVFADLDRMIAMFKEIAGLQNPSIGTSDPESRSGRAILALREAADMRVVVPSNGIASGLRMLGEQVLGLIAQFMPDQTQMEIVSEDGSAEVLSFQGKSFVAKAQNKGPASLLYDIKVDISEKPNPVEVENRIELLLAAGVLDPRMNADDILRALRDNDLKALDPSESDRDRADEENLVAMMVSQQIADGSLSIEPVATEDGQEIIPADAALQGGIKLMAHQDHGVDIRTHGRFLNKTYMQLHPLVVEYLGQHVRAHQMELQQQIAMAMQARDQVQQRVQPPGRARQQQAAPGVRRSESQSYGGR